ncbi:MAG: hypothetical protein HY231_16450 [Acidobacteria bacterium]|nr:hypothetical protein [Acidobacteriota bacterium]
MKKIISTTGLLLLLAATSLAQDWKSHSEPYGLRTAQVAAEGITPDGAAHTTLTIQCASGKGAMASIIYSVIGADKMKRFRFEDFEGPDAVAASKKLTTIQVVYSTGEAVSEKTQVSGSFSDSDTFAFELSAQAKLASEVTRLTTAMAAPNAAKIIVTVQDNKNPQHTLQTEFPVGGATSAVNETMKGCNAPPARKR